MDSKKLSEFSKKVVSTLKKYKYAALVLLLGIALLLLPSGKSKKEEIGRASCRERV